MNAIFEPWPWYISGPFVAFIMILLIYFGKTFGMSSNLRTLCTLGGAGKFSNFFNNDWKDQKWNLIVAFGVIIGAYLATHYLSNDSAMSLSVNTISELQTLGFEHIGKDLVPPEIFSLTQLTSTKNLVILITGGLLIGFGTRYAGGCTSGHAITGLSNLQLPSLIAVIGFFIGGLIMTNFILPLIF